MTSHTYVFRRLRGVVAAGRKEARLSKKPIRQTIRLVVRNQHSYDCTGVIVTVHPNLVPGTAHYEKQSGTLLPAFFRLGLLCFVPGEGLEALLKRLGPRQSR